MWVTNKRKRVRPESRKEDGADMAKGAGAAAWVREKLKFQPDAAQERVLTTQSRRVVMNCTRQWGEIDGDGGEGALSGVHGGGKPDAGGEPERAADRRVPAQGGRVRAETGAASEGGWRQRDVAGAAEPVADCGGAGE